MTIDNSTLVVIGVYQPGSVKPTSQFFDDLTTVLEFVALLLPFRHQRDFNIHVEDPLDADAANLADIFEMFDLAQRVDGTTHYCGGTLDLVVTPDDMSNVSVTVHPPRVIPDHASGITL